MQDFEITIHNRPSIRFTGDYLGKVSSKRPGADFWTDLEAYLTNGGKYIVVTRGMAADKRKRERIGVEVFDSVPEMINLTGTGLLAMRLYRELGIGSITIE